MKNPSTFKRVAIGENFTSNQNGSTGTVYRKFSEKEAVRLLPTGRGDTANKVRFSRSHAVLV
jgi:hypothetical protein